MPAQASRRENIRPKLTLDVSSRTNLSGARLAGTLRWVAPEPMFDKKLKMDMYALGLLTWETTAN
ncbi:hypothetical protein DFQ26_003885, partial [Actinomortierella ambigua]